MVVVKAEKSQLSELSEGVNRGSEVEIIKNESGNSLSYGVAFDTEPRVQAGVAGVNPRRKHLRWQ